MDRASLIAEARAPVAAELGADVDTRARPTMQSYVLAPAAARPTSRRLLGFAAIAWSVSALSLAFIVMARPLWFDEILGRLMCQLAWPDGVLAACDAGVDLTPPGWFLIARLAETALAGHDRAARWIAMAFVALAAVLVHRMAAERWGRAAGSASAAALLLTAARDFATEGRSYGALIGLCALALFAWQRAVESNESSTSGRVASTTRRRLWIAVLAASLASAVLVHYYAVMMWAPLAAGELVRRRRRGAWDYPILVALAASLLPLVPLIPHAMRGADIVKLAPFSEPGLQFVGKHYRFLFDALRWPIIVLAAVFLVRGGFRGLGVRVRWLCRTPFAVAVLMLVALPAYAMLAAALGSGISHPRYALPATVGMSLLAGYLVHALRLAPTGPTGERAVANLLLLVGTGTVAYEAFVVGVRAKSAFAEVAALAPPDLPIVVNHPIGGLEAWYVADEALRRRMLIAADPACSVANGDRATADINLTGLARVSSMPIESWDELRTRHPRFVVLLPPGHVSYWLRQKAAAAAAEQTLVAATGGWEAWETEMCAGPRATTSPNPPISRTSSRTW